MNNKLIHIGDLGLKNHKYGGINPKTGLNKRFEDVYSSFISIVTYAIKNKIKYFLITGDINEERNPDSLVIEKFTFQINRLIENNIKVILIAGNHDIDSAFNSSTSISNLKVLKLKNLYIADKKEEIFIIDDVKFFCVPYFTKHSKKLKNNVELQEHVNNLISTHEHDKNYKNILVSHYSTEKNFEGMNIDEVKLNFQSMREFDYIALGHIHTREMYDKYGVNGGFPGSIYIKDFGENNKKYFNLVDIETCEYEKVEIPTREFFEIRIDCTGCEQDEINTFIIDQLKGKIKDKIVKIKLDVYETFNPKIIYEFLRNEKVFHNLPIMFNKISQNAHEDIKSDIGLNDNEIVLDYLTNQKIDKKFKNDISVYIEGIINGCS